MKPAPFELRIVSTLDEALEELAEAGDEGRPLAGGQSLIPLLNFRMSQPGVLVDLGDVEELRFLRRTPDGGLAIGAMTTQTELLESAVVAESHPIIGQAVRYVAHEPIRNRGTIGGSLAHLDPAAEMPALALLLDMELVASSRSGRRTIGARDFMLGAYMSALEEGELLSEVRVPPLPSGAGSSVIEVAQRAGDFALAGAACLVDQASDGTVRELRAVTFGASAEPTRLPEIETSAVGRPMSGELALEVAEAYAAGIAPLEDRAGSASYRRHLTRVMVTRALREAAGLSLRPTH